jgi:hypothetical protein
MNIPTFWWEQKEASAGTDACDVFRHPLLFLRLDGLGPPVCSHSELILKIINLTHSFGNNFLLV